jgi:alanyl-tRNA synthetase
MARQLSGHEIRKLFLEFFRERKHTVVPSSPLPSDDPSVLLTTAGMQQFKPYYLGKESPYGNRVSSVQKTFRTSDIEEVGDATHLTFFEMLGNFSFNYPKGQGSYFKEETIRLGLEFVSDELGVDRKRITVSVFGGDQEVPLDTESIAIWKNLGFDDSEIRKGNREDNFWGPTGDEGPCGPTSEIYVGDVEVWNLVFNEYFRSKDGQLIKLTAQGVDTGMGLERTAQVIQDKEKIGDTDLFALINEAIRKSIPSIDDRSMRIISDHLRGSIFLIADGVLPGNKEQGYILRRLLRRSLARARDRGKGEWFKPVIDAVVESYGDAYPELKKQKIAALTVISEEAAKFSKTIQKGLRAFEKTAQDLVKRGEHVIPSRVVFDLHQSTGTTIDILGDLAGEKGLSIDREAFERDLEEHREISRAGQQRKFGGHGLLTSTGEITGGSEEEQKRILRMHTATHLLHQALRDVLGDTVQQKGSDINGERLRFDFSFSCKLTPEEMAKVAEIVNKKIQDDLPVYRQEMERDDAEKTGALAFFKEKYGDRVSVYLIGSDDPHKAYSKEFCAGPHVERTGEIGEFKILKEEAVGAGVRRIKATVE